MTQQAEPTVVQNNLNTSEVVVESSNTPQDLLQEDNSGVEVLTLNNASMLAPEHEPFHNGESNCPSSIMQYESQDDQVIEVGDELSKSFNAGVNGGLPSEQVLPTSRSEVRIRQQVTSSPQLKVQKCWNKMCCSNEATRKIKSRVQDKTLLLCRTCASSYNGLKFCEVCEQIYPNQDAGDGFEWVLCQSDTCSRWNHVECEVKRGRYDKKSQYLCSECERRNRRKRLPVVENLELGRLSKDKKQIQVSADKRIHIFDVRKDNYHYLQPFLSTYSYRLALADDAINSDLYAIRHKQNNNGDQTKRHTDVVNKKKKR